MPLVALGVWASCLVTIYTNWLVGLAMAVVAALLSWKFGGNVAFQALSTVSFGVVLGSLVASLHVANRDSAPISEWVEEEKSGEARVTLLERPRPLANNRDFLKANATLTAFYPETSGGDPVPGGDAGAIAEGRWRVLIIADREDWLEIDEDSAPEVGNADHNQTEALPTEQADPATGSVEGEPVHRQRYLVTAGDTIEIEADLRAPNAGSLTTSVIFTRGPPVVIDGAPWWQRWADPLHENLHHATAGLTREEAGLLAGLAVGDSSEMPTDVTDDFRTTGLAHLVVTSGFHTNLVLGSVMLVAFACRAGPRAQFVVAVVTLLAFVILVGPQPSVLRAAVLAALVCLAFALSRPSSGLSALAVAVTLVLLIAPYLAGELGFALSVSACVGLIVFAFRWSRKLEHRGWPRAAAVAVTIPVAAQAAVTPLLVGIDGEISLVSVPVNILSTFVAAPAVVISVATIAAASIWMPLGELVAQVAAIPVRGLIFLAEKGAQVPGGTLPWPQGTWWAIFLAAIIVALLIAVHVKALRGWVMLLAVIPVLIAPLWWLRGPSLPDGMVVTMCDVGQGDAFILPGHADGVILVDVGPDDQAIDDCLSDFGIRHIDLLVVSHFHMDHVGGIRGALRGRNVDAVLIPPPADAMHGHGLMTDTIGSNVGARSPTKLELVHGPDQSAIEVDSNEPWSGSHSAEIIAAEGGQSFQLGKTTIDVVAPLGAEWLGTRSDSNNNSIVVAARTHGIRTLLTGDIEVEAQDEILKSPHDLSSDILKVPHHGSGYFDPEFFSAVNPTVALIGVGEENSYGHPDPEVMTFLQENNILVKQSDRHGTVTLGATDEGRINVQSSRAT